MVTGKIIGNMVGAWNVDTDINDDLLYNKQSEHSLYNLVEINAVSDSLGNY